MGNAGTFMKYVARGDSRFISSLFFKSLFPQKDENETPNSPQKSTITRSYEATPCRQGNRDNKIPSPLVEENHVLIEAESSPDKGAGKTTTTWLRLIITFGVQLLLIAAALISLCCKITSLHIVTCVGVQHWTRQEVLQMLGFANQIAGLFDVDMIELNKLLLFKFAGAHIKWDEDLLDDVEGYFSLMSMKLVDGTIHEHRAWPGMWSLILLYDFDADDAQRLLLSDKRLRIAQEMVHQRLYDLDVLLDA